MGTRRRERMLKLEPLDEGVVERVAYIFGECSGASKALSELKTRRASGEDVRLFKSGNVIVVGPPLSPRPNPDARI